ncbi:hypothetical protein, conserved in T. vivax [Trypanosoma vivax Y486]|uniref:Uncharacterized protein n=1 Tax=Trypanosoma vivax (strain Y486) TaxID=1055687 RepID=F9WMY6_TRYVY|nr:hypothetical protein, conserved in T. vivax [Trypanosoma vivax Y486]|eukprot:CCD21800.1 hypothetical protein, conserved in T. vivax [Trypanosoma vivax Y486]
MERSAMLARPHTARPCSTTGRVRRHTPSWGKRQHTHTHRRSSRRVQRAKFARVRTAARHGNPQALAQTRKETLLFTTLALGNAPSAGREHSGQSRSAQLGTRARDAGERAAV